MSIPPTEGPHRTTAGRALPLQWLLPLLTTSVVVAVLATALILSSALLRRTAIASAEDRVQRGAHQLATVTTTAVQASWPRYAAVAHDSVLRRALSTTNGNVDTRAIQRTLERLTTPNDSGLPVELWSADRRRIAFVGDNIHDAIEARQSPEISEHPPLPHDGLDSIKMVDSLQIGDLYPSGGRVYFWIVAPVIDHGVPLGYIVQQRRLATNRQSEQTLRELSGTEIAAYYRNVDAKFWATLGGRPAPIQRLSQTESIVAEERIGGTPLVFVLEMPRAAVLAEPMALIRRLTWLSVALAALGALLAWAIGGRVARPIGMLTRAAESVARGDYTARVPTGGPIEVARLSENFNHMAAQIGDAAAELEQREAEFRALANAIPQLAWMASSDGSVFWYNQRWFEYTGTTLDQMQGWGWQLVHDPALLPDVLARWRNAIRLGQRFEMEFTLRGADGADRWFLTRVEPVYGRDGAVVRWFGTNTDIEDLREARESARAASRAKSDFLATMSHELRTPLNAIGGYAELLEMELRGPVTDAQRRDLARIRASQQHLLGLISGVLDLSRIESGRVTYNLAHMQAHPLLAGLDALVAPQAGAKNLVLEYPGASRDLVVIADHEKLRQILLNLLSNAIRYTPPGGHIVMTVSAEDDATVAIAVSDNGPGIPLDRQAVVFEPFVQLDRSLTQTLEGVGLGLAISRDLARGMGGELSVESAHGEGACFTVTLPRGSLDQVVWYPHTDEMPAAGAS
ncbi:MAG TPA: ATP-binding protein [Gemmatimonadaceae bacterium]|nr:ATP-binding protein [Gemmatimonadaceae bacterium]